MKRRGDRGSPLIENGRTKWTNKWRLDIKIKVCFCPQKRMSPPVPQTVVIGKKSIWVTNKIMLQWITKKKLFNPWNTKKNWSKVLKAKQGLQVLFHIAMAKFPIPENCSSHVPMILKEFCSSKINGLVMKTFSGK